MGKLAVVPKTPIVSEDPVSPVVLRAFLGRLRGAMLQASRLHVAAAPPPRAELMLLADELDGLADQVRALTALRGA